MAIQKVAKGRKQRGKTAGEAVKYRRIREQLTEEIRTGRLAPGVRLPSDQQMARRFDASRGTVIRALLDLTHAGLVERRRGSGSYVKAAGTSTARWVALLGPAPASEPSHTSTLGLIAQSVAGEAGHRCSPDARSARLERRRHRAFDAPGRAVPPKANLRPWPEA